MTSQTPVPTAHAKPKLFISYSWGEKEKDEWVIGLAEELTARAIHVVFDKWDLQPGHDAAAFMESMVSDPDINRVILICDESYVDKSNKRAGGAGIEAQILTAELYAQKSQDKFVAVIRERDKDGHVFLPTYYGRRIYIDLSSSASYTTEFERLVRWAWDEPLYTRPELGSRPDFLKDEKPKKIPTDLVWRRAVEATRAYAPNGPSLVGEYFHVLTSGLETFRLTTSSRTDNAFDDKFIQNIDEFITYRNEFIELISVVIQSNNSGSYLERTHRFFESLIPFFNRPNNVHSWMDTDFDNFCFLGQELFLYTIAVCLKYENFDFAAYLIDNEYYWENTSRPDALMHSYSVFRSHVKTLTMRNQRLTLNRLSLQADLMNERSVGTGVDFKYIMAADFILYIRGITSDGWLTWWPDTLLYAGRFGGAFELFARSSSKRYFERIKALLGVSDKKSFGDIIEKVQANPNYQPRWQFEGVNIERLSGWSNLATKP